MFQANLQGWLGVATLLLSTAECCACALTLPGPAEVALPAGCAGGDGNTWEGLQEWQEFLAPTSVPAQPPTTIDVEDFKVLVPIAKEGYLGTTTDNGYGFWNDDYFNVGHWKSYTPSCAYIYSNVSLCKMWDQDGLLEMYSYTHYNAPYDLFERITTPWGKQCLMISAQIAGNGGVDTVCGSPDVSILYHEAVFAEVLSTGAAGVHDFVGEMCDRTLDDILNDGRGEFRWGVKELLQLNGAWSDTPHCIMNVRPHQCLCLAEPLPENVESTSLWVNNNETAVVVALGDRQHEVAIRGSPFPQAAHYAGSLQFTSYAVSHHPNASKVLQFVISTVAICWAIFGLSNYREVCGLWQMQRHALVFYYKVGFRPSSKPLRTGLAGRWLYRLGLLKSPPVVDGIAVEPVVPEEGYNGGTVHAQGRASGPAVETVPKLHYLAQFKAWNAHTTPIQRRTEIIILLVEGILLWGFMWLLSLVTAGVVVNPFGYLPQLKYAPQAFERGQLRPGRVSNQFLQAALVLVALLSTVIALGAILLNWLLLAITSKWAWAGHRFPGLHGRLSGRQVQNFLYLWTTNLAGVAELSLVYTVQVVPGIFSDTILEDQSDLEARDRRLATVQFYTVCGYAMYAAAISAVAINVPVLRVIEDVFLGLFALFQSAVMVYNATYIKDGELALFIDDGKGSGRWRSCVDLVGSDANLTVDCQVLAATCAQHTPGKARSEGNPDTDWSTIIQQIIVVVFKSAAVWYERWMGVL